ncbi:bifunctional hemolysin/adenylate cyclase precursor [Variibacter gotjawalensis]|uniref:Bifunctional hemolysin/adenylate cyclase n=1 Tax=Variibacter gotjawalensis TaxID=1333996 RepID=A0A0S3PSH4_9BRAD|nr:calcium-binding protein [Variibacter gotjawalensis]NIK49160.1 Ca2+-binding RTX toxin-like protein [Variibacter gotjawalensis]RZS51016.1 hemolysin type calcium-binding protein [Variibacter gotjawalensis]BAT58850.1 bifunctional hemolysin/adenylate cyclase precursor [Variibacter gotjawalensis]
MAAGSKAKSPVASSKKIQALLSDGDDTQEIRAGEPVNGPLDGGAGNDTLKLIGPGLDSLGANQNFENLDVQSGTWSVNSAAYDMINIRAGAMVTSQLRLAPQGDLGVSAGATLLVTNGTNAVTSTGAGNVDNAGSIIALGATANAINGGTLYNRVGGLILAQLAVIVSEAAAAPGNEIVNEGMMQSLSGRAIVLNGDAGDLLVNTRTGSIVGSVETGGGNDLITNQGSIAAAGGTAIDAGAGNDTVNLHAGSTLVGKVILGAGNDVLSSQMAGALDIDAGDGQDSIATGDGNDRILGGAGIDLIHAGGGNDIIEGGADNDTLNGGTGNDIIDGGAGEDTASFYDDAAGVTVNFATGTATGAASGNDTLISIEKVITGTGNDTIIVSTAGPLPTGIDGGAGTDTVRLIGTGTGALVATTGVENLVVQQGTWTAAASDYSAVTIQGGARLNSTVNLNNNDKLTVETGGILANPTAINWAGGGNAIVDNAGRIESSTRVLNTTAGATGTLTFNNLIGGTVVGPITPAGAGQADAVITLNNAGTIESGVDGRAIDFRTFDNNGANAVINNNVGGIIRKIGGDDADVIRPGADATVNNRGTITTVAGWAGGGDAIDFQGDAGGKVNNWGLIEGSKHAVTGSQALTVVNNGTMIGRNGSAVNIDNGGTEAEKVFITNNAGAVMEGRSAELGDSDGDAVDVDGLAQILNYGRISGLGHQGYHDGEPNVSEGIAIGGGTILNYGKDAIIYGYGRAIQVDNSGNANALGKTFINNEGLIQGDGHGPEGVSAADAARFDLRGNEAVNLVGDYADELLNQSTGRIVGGVSMGGGNDHLQSLGAFVATGGSAIDMGAGNDTVYFYTGTTVQGTVLLGTGDDLVLSTADTSLVIEGGDSDDQMYIGGYTVGDDILSGGAGNDRIYAGIGEDQIDGGIGNDALYGEAGDDLILGGAGDDTIDGGADDDVLYGDAGNDTMIGGLGDDILKGGADNDTFIITSTADGHDKYDGGAGIDTVDFSAVTAAVTLTLRDTGTSSFATDTFENIENAIGGSGADKLTGNAFANVLVGNGGDDILKGGAGDDRLEGGEGADDLDGGADNDTLLGGADNDIIKGGAGNDIIIGGAGADTLTGGAGNDVFVFTSIGDGIDTITDFRTSGASEDHFQFSASMFTGFTGDDAFDLIGSGYLRAVAANGSTQIQVDVDGGGNNFQTLAIVNGTISNGILADHVALQFELIA